MKIRFLEGLSIGIRSVFIRFPVPVVCILTTCIFSIAAVEIEDSPLADTLLRWILICGLAFVATLLIDLVCLARQSTKRVRIFASLLALAVVLAFTHLLVPPLLEDALPPFWYGFWITLFALHLGIALSPLAGNRNPQTFWHFNLWSFHRFSFSTINAILLFVGLALALASIDQLFGLEINQKLYFQIWLLAAFAVHPLIFLGGIPCLNEIHLDADYPQPLRFTLQFIALPLVALYLLIIYAYIVKIGVTAQWPDGWLAMPIFILSVISTLTAILSLPLAQSDFWAKLYHRWLYRLLWPLSIVLFLALQVRLQDYGMTINRYMALALAVWLFVISLAYIIRPRLHLAWLPGSLLIISLFSVWGGPLGAFAWSQRSQINQVHAISAEAGALLDGAFVRSTTPENLSNKQVEQLSSSLRYILSNFGSDSLRPELRDFRASADNDEFDSSYSYSQAQSILAHMELNPHTNNERTYYHYSGAMPTGNHAWMTQVGSLSIFQKGSSRNIDLGHTNGQITLKFNKENQTLTVSLEDAPLCEVDASGWLGDIFEARTENEYNQLAKPVYWDFKGKDWSFRFVLESANLKKDLSDSPQEIDYLSGRLFYTPPD